MPSFFDINCANTNSRVDGWTRVGGSSAICITPGRCPGDVNGVELSGGGRYVIKYPLPSLVLGVGYSGAYFKIPTLDGNPASVYWIITYTKPGTFNFYDDPAIGVNVRGDGSIAVQNDHTTFAVSSAGLVAANTIYILELAGLAHDVIGSSEVRLNSVAVPGLTLNTLHTQSLQVTSDGFDQLGLGGPGTVDFYAFYFSETGFEGESPCGTQFAGVTAFTHTFERGTLRTLVEIGGQPKGGYKRWRPLGQKPYPKLPGSLPIPPLPVEGGVAIRNVTEVRTIAAAAFTDTLIQIPDDVIVLSVYVRVIVTIPTATSFDVGDSGNTTRYSTASVSTAAGSSDPGSKAGGYYNATGIAVRLTMNGGTPATNAGRVLVTINYVTGI